MQTVTDADMPRLWMPEPHIRRHAAKTRAVLVQRYPGVFMPRGEAKRPLKLGITWDVVDDMPEANRRHIRLAVRDYCSGPTYFLALLTDPVRVGLDGQPAGVVTDQHRAYAEAMLVRWEAHGFRRPVIVEVAA